MNTDHYIDFTEKVYNLMKALLSNNKNNIEKAKLDCLWEASNLFELVVNYISLYRFGIYFDFGSDIIRKGTKLFRIRSFQNGVDFSQPKEWLPPPNKPQNRANKQGEEALYLASTETVCYLETHTKPDEIYVLGTYECQEDIKVGGFFTFSSQNTLYTLAAIVLNAFLIAPSRGGKNKDLFNFLDSYFGHISLNDLSDMKNITDANEEMRLPYKFAVLNQEENLYKLTNQLCEIISKSYINGIRYSSCYIPLESPGIICSDYNVVLYSPGIKKVSFVNYEIKSFPQNKGYIEFNCTNAAKALLGVYKDDQT